ncbi:hypothetical protein M758_3G201900 [Ceratodon purpureus]|nr:hypothetical protein M758_3G201900 [Ceratodon purpureus]
MQSYLVIAASHVALVVTGAYCTSMKEMVVDSNIFFLLHRGRQLWKGFANRVTPLKLKRVDEMSNSSFVWNAVILT